MNARHEKIIDLISRRQEASVHRLAEQFAVSVMTIRRDLMLLERMGKLTRTHGGAMLSRAGVVEFAFLEEGKKHALEKRAIARKAAALLQEGMAVSLDSGTTTLEVAKAIVNIKRLTVLTSSLAIASVLYAHENIELVLLGGTVRKGSPDLTGWLTEENVKLFQADLAIVGADGINKKGAFTTAVDATRVCQAIMAGAERRILVADHSKFKKGSFAKFASLKDFDHIVTDAKVPRSTRAWLSKAANTVVYAQTET